MTGRLIGLGLGLGLGLGCKVDRKALLDRVFSCDPTAHDPACGAGEVCYSAPGLGASPMCVPECGGEGERTPPYQTDTEYCTSDGQQLDRCTPGQVCSTDGLSCLRTKLLTDNGVCLHTTPCTADTDCNDPARRRCASSVLAQLYPNAHLHTDQLWCTEQACTTPGVTCAPGDVCLGALNGFPPLCVPECDSQDRCPPSFVCLEKIVPAFAVPACVPGLPGLPCANDEDCMIGICVAIDGARSVCAPSCTTDADCIPFDDRLGDDPLHFLCAEGGHCIAPASLNRQVCQAAADCPMGDDCVAIPSAHLSICRKPCVVDADCPSRLGITLGCGDGYCTPRIVGAACGTDSDCEAGLSCVSGRRGDHTRCGARCSTDDDCHANRWLGQGFHCTRRGFCASGGALFGLCNTSAQCNAGLACIDLSVFGFDAVCLPPCSADMDCATVNTEGDRPYCSTDIGVMPGGCLPRAASGSGCGANYQCQSNMCVNGHCQ